MSRMTEEESWALEELVTRRPPKVDPSKARYVSRTPFAEAGAFRDGLCAAAAAQAACGAERGRIETQRRGRGQRQPTSG